MKKYEKPVVMINEELAEGVYAASGCYTVQILGHQTPRPDRMTHKYQFDATHSTTHMGHNQRWIVTFDQPINYVSSSGTLIGNGINVYTITIAYTYTQNPSDHIGLGDLEVSVVADGDGSNGFCTLNNPQIQLLCDGNGDF